MPGNEVCSLAASTRLRRLSGPDGMRHLYRVALSGCRQQVGRRGLWIPQVHAMCRTSKSNFSTPFRHVIRNGPLSRWLDSSLTSVSSILACCFVLACLHTRQLLAPVAVILRSSMLRAMSHGPRTEQELSLERIDLRAPLLLKWLHVGRRNLLESRPIRR